MAFLFCCSGGACFFLLFGRAGTPPKQQKIKHATAQTAKKKASEAPKQQKRPDAKKINTLTLGVNSLGLSAQKPAHLVLKLSWLIRLHQTESR